MNNLTLVASLTKAGYSVRANSKSQVLINPANGRQAQINGSKVLFVSKNNVILGTLSATDIIELVG